MDKKYKEIEFLEPYIDRLTENLARAHNLVGIYNYLYGKGKGRRSVPKADILRAAVVFIHASLEDFLRSLSAAYLPKADEEILNFIPLKGLSNTGRPEKFFLGKLVMHRGKSVEQVIEESIEQHLERTNYNNTQEIASLLSSLGFDIAYVSHTFSDLDQMMRRRHQIVHRADRVEGRGKGKQYAQSIKPADVLKWIDAAKTFMSRTLYQVYLKESGGKLPSA